MNSKKFLTFCSRKVVAKNSPRNFFENCLEIYFIMEKKLISFREFHNLVINKLNFRPDYNLNIIF